MTLLYYNRGDKYLAIADEPIKPGLYRCYRGASPFAINTKEVGAEALGIEQWEAVDARRVPSEWIRAFDLKEKQRLEDQRWCAVAGSVLILLICIGPIYLAASGGGSSSRSQSNYSVAVSTDYQAKCYAEQGIKKLLKAPSTAKFGIPAVKKCVEGNWVVTGYVDAQNGFGAMLRKDYSVEVDQDGRLVSVDM